MNAIDLLNGITTRHAVDKILARVLEIHEGELLTHAEIEALTHATRPTRRYWTLMQRARDRSEKETGFALVAEANAGYRKVRGVDQLKASNRYDRRAVRALKRGHQMASVVDDARLPEPYRRVRDFQVQRRQTLLLAVADCRKTLLRATGNPERVPLPLPVPNDLSELKMMQEEPFNRE